MSTSQAPMSRSSSSTRMCARPGCAAVPITRYPLSVQRDRVCTRPASVLRCLCPGPRQGDDEPAAVSGRTFDVDLSLMAANDLTADCQPQASSPNLAFGGKEWLKNMRQIVRGNPWASIGDLDLAPAGRAEGPGRLAVGPQGHPPGRPDGLEGIHAQIEQDLLQLLWIT